MNRRGCIVGVFFCESFACFLFASVLFLRVYCECLVFASVLRVFSFCECIASVLRVYCFCECIASVLRVYCFCECIVFVVNIEITLGRFNKYIYINI
jgi:hypothetical protein